MTRIAILTISDRASRGDYEDLGGPVVESWLRAAIANRCDYVRSIVPDGLESVRNALVELCDRDGADLVLTTGGTGPALRDLTPEAMRQVVTKELPGFGELMRQASLVQVPTAILSRQSAGVRGRTLIINLPGKPSAIDVCLAAVFPAVPYCLELIGAGRIEMSVRFGEVGSARPVQALAAAC
ncbi:molybdopterin adenylyltransferase [Mesorhizobium sp. PUT5]|uniref:molybdopterin adenylyltransferase n=1 Tax=Mesorhizobium sp. PUT5 TaxID=3454629 RepID=UPI003FA48B97